MFIRASNKKKKRGNLPGVPQQMPRMPQRPIAPPRRIPQKGR